MLPPRVVSVGHVSVMPRWGTNDDQDEREDALNTFAAGSEVTRKSEPFGTLTLLMGKLKCQNANIEPSVGPPGQGGAWSYPGRTSRIRVPTLLEGVASSALVARVRRSDYIFAEPLSKDRMEALVESMELLGNPDFIRALKEHKAGRGKQYDVTELDAEMSA